MAATYPIDKLPYPIRDGYRAMFHDKLRKRQMDDGNTSTRRRFETQPQKQNLTWRMSWDQFALFEAFLSYDCAHGAESFLMPLSPSEAAIEMRFLKYPDSTFDPSCNSWNVTGEVQTFKYGVPTGIRLAYCVPGYVKPGYWNEIEPEMMFGYPAFPSAIPYPEKSNYSIKRESEFATTNISEGYMRNRTRFQDSVATYQCRWILDASQKAVFDNFVYNVLYGGYAPFYAPFANGEGNTYVRSKFVELPSVGSMGAIFEATATLESANIPVMTETEYQGLI